MTSLHKTLTNFFLLPLTYYFLSSILLSPFKTIFLNQLITFFYQILTLISIKLAFNLYLSRVKSKSKTTKIVVNQNYVIPHQLTSPNDQKMKIRSPLKIPTHKTIGRPTKSKSKILRIQKIITSTRNKIKFVMLNLQKPTPT